MSKFLWKVWLRPNKLTANPNDYVAEVDTAGSTRTSQDIVDFIVADGSEIKAETIKAVLERVNHAKRYFLLQGYSLFDDFIHISPRITGAWTGKESFTAGKHKVTIDASLSKEMHEELKHVGVEVLGVADSKARIMLVTDIATGKTDGTITSGDDILIVGDLIKLVGKPQPDGSPDPDVNIFFIGPDGLYGVPDRVSENTPTRIVARVPKFAPGEKRTLRIVTRYSRGNILTTPRTIEYDLQLTTR